MTEVDKPADAMRLAVYPDAVAWAVAKSDRKRAWRKCARAALKYIGGRAQTLKPQGDSPHLQAVQPV